MMELKKNDQKSNHSNGNSNCNSKYLKFMSFFINNKSSDFEQLTTMMKMIQKIFNNMIDEKVGQNPSNYGNSDRSSNTRLA